MSRILATYLVKVTVREPEIPEAAKSADDAEPLVLTNDQMAEVVRVSVELATSCPVGTTSERTDI